MSGGGDAQGRREETFPALEVGEAGRTGARHSACSMAIAHDPRGEAKARWVTEARRSVPSFPVQESNARIEQSFWAVLGHVERAEITLAPEF